MNYYIKSFKIYIDRQIDNQIDRWIDGYIDRKKDELIGICKDA